MHLPKRSDRTFAIVTALPCPDAAAAKSKTIFNPMPTEFDPMNITRRNVTIGGISLLAGTSMSTSGHAELG